jgi:sarcosine dehydrogenase
LKDTPDFRVKEFDYYGAYETGAWRLAGNPDIDVEGIPKHESHPYHEIINGELTFGWPASHDIVKEEVRACREGVAIFDQSYFGKFFLSGKDVDKFVQYLCGADMENKTLGQITYTPLCNHRGGVEADPTVTRLPDGSGYYISTGGGTQTHNWAWINSIIEEGDFDV